MSDYKSHEEQEEPILRHSNRTRHVIVTKNKQSVTGAFNESMNRADTWPVDIMYNYCSAMQQGASEIWKLNVKMSSFAWRKNAAQLVTEPDVEILKTTNSDLPDRRKNVV